MDLMSDALQTAIFDRLSADSTLQGFIGTHVYDAVPAGPVPDSYVLIGEDVVSDASDKGAHGAYHKLTISVVSSADSFLALKQISAAIMASLDTPALDLSRGQICGLWFLAAHAKRSRAGGRRIDLSFRARVSA